MGLSAGLLPSHLNSKLSSATCTAWLLWQAGRQAGRHAGRQAGRQAGRFLKPPHRLNCEGVENLWEGCPQQGMRLEEGRCVRDMVRRKPVADCSDGYETRERADCPFGVIHAWQSISLGQVTCLPLVPSAMSHGMQEHRHRMMIRSESAESAYC